MAIKRWEIPEFETIKAHRRYVKEHLAASCVALGELGFDNGVSGLLSVRDPEFLDHFWLSPYGVSFGDVSVSKLVEVDTNGVTLSGDYPINDDEFVIHSAVYSLRTDVMSIVHAHTMYAEAYSSLGVLLDPITYEACAFYKDHSIYTDFELSFGSVEEAKNIAYTLGENKACILQNHGLMTVGQTIDEAVWWLISMERSCKAQILADSCGKPLRIANDIAEARAEKVGSSFSGWLNFQPLYSKAVSTFPFLLK